MTPDEPKQIAEFFGGLSNEMQALSVRFDRVETGIRELHERFDTKDARVERHAALLQTGSRWVNRMNQGAEKIDRIWEARDRRIFDHEARLRQLEGGNGNHNPPNSGG